MVKKKDEFIDMFCEKLDKLRFHHFISKQQNEHLQKLKDELAVGEVLVLADFSENFAFIVQDAIQGFHWNNCQATVHGFVVYYRTEEGGELHHKNFIVISDNLVHDIYAFYAFYTKFIEFITSPESNIPKIHTVKLCTDGPSSQYKSMYSVAVMCFHFFDFNIKVEWHFHGTSHGKTNVDGLCGGFKRAIGLASLNPEVLITTAKAMFDFSVKKWHTGEQQDNKITFAYVSDEEIQEIKENVLEERFSSALPVPGIRRIHFIKPLSINHIETKLFSASTESAICIVRHGRVTVSPEDLKPGTFVTVAGEDQWTLGQVVTCDESKVQLKILEPPGQSSKYKFPSKENSVEVQLTQILTVVSPKETVTPKRGITSYKLYASDVKKSNEQLEYFHEVR